MKISIFPTPRQCRVSAATFNYSTHRWVHVDPAFSTALKKHVLTFAADLSRHFSSPLQVATGRPSQGGILLEVAKRRRGIAPQGYELATERAGVRLVAGDEAGAYYGLQTLRQMIEQTGARMPGLRIADHPDFPQRGVMLDISRCKVPTMASLFAYVDLLAQFKINHLQLYTEHTFAFAAHEPVWHDASPVTAAEVLTLDAYCRERYIELVPNLNSFGHFGRWLRHPEYRRLAESPGGASDMLRPDRQSLRFLKSLYQEFLPNFSSRLFNVGCDETWELGKGFSRALCEKKGTTRVYLDFLLQIHKLVRRHNRRMMFWGDIILRQPGLIREIPRDIIALNWGYEAAHPFDKEARRFAAAGVPFYVCPGTSSWKSLTGRTTNCMANLDSAARHGLEHGSIGYLITDWGDGGHHQYVPISYIGIAGGAAFAWCRRSNPEPAVASALSRLVFQDKAAVLGALFWELGKVPDLLKHQPGNCTMFNSMLHSNLKDPLPREIDIRSLRKCLERFDALERRIADARPAAGDGDLVKAELRNAIAMARHGARRGLAVLQKRADKAALRRELQHIISAHEDLWLARNRRGGLAESSGALRAALAPLM